MDRNETIKAIRSALKKRTGRPWSVTGGSGTAWGWITIASPPARRTWHSVEVSPGVYEHRNTGERGGYIGVDDRKALARALALDSVHPQGVGVPAGQDYYDEYVDRAEGRTPRRIGNPYWD